MADLRKSLSFLALLALTTLSTSMIVPFTGYYIVEGLGHEPWTISLYATLSILLTVAINRAFSTRLDQGARAFPLIGLAGGGFVLANLALTLSPGYGTLITFGVLGFGVSGSATATLFSLGQGFARDREIKPERFNAYMRATTSAAWMVGPAVSFLIADISQPAMVFRAALGMALLWLLMWWRFVPRDATVRAKPTADEPKATIDPGLWPAVAVCFCISFGHSLSFTALPLFYVKELGLPDFAPGVAFSVKTFIEVIAILATPMLIARFSLPRLLTFVAALAVVANLALASVTSFHTMVAAAAFEGFYYGLYASLGISFVQTYAGARMAHATATYWNMIKIAGLIAGPMAGLIAQYYSFHLVVQLAALGGVLSMALLLTAPNFRHSRATNG